MPSGNTRELYNSHATFRDIVATQSNHILQIITSVTKVQGIRGNIANRRDAEEKFELLQESNDVMLERVNNNLDDLLGIRKSPETVVLHEDIFKPERRTTNLNGSWNRTLERSVSVQSARLLIARNVQRPQASFKVPVDNSSNAWCPRIKYKPNSIKPLSLLAEYDDDGKIVAYTHPYEIELDRFEANEDLLKELPVKEPLDIETTDFAYIDDIGDLKRALSELEKETELAVDLEHHSYRTFQGITCLMQISTRNKDYIIDTIALREDLHILNEVFTNPKITKIFHGADMDVEWLQRDLSLYIVNLFDTHQAAKRLGFARLSLAYLMKHYCNIDADKTFQLADWRMRPLPEELINYARQDTHFLLFIYDNMRNELIKNSNEGNNLIKSVYQASTELCKKRYFKPIIGPTSYMDVYRKSKKMFDNRQLYALQGIFAWRDKIARQEDESYGYVLPNHMMLHISEVLPREMQGILACCNPIPPLVKQHLHILHQIILKAREQSLVKVVGQDVITVNRESTISNYRDNENPLYCPHDILLHASDEGRLHLPCLLDENRAVEAMNENLLKHPEVSAIGNVDESLENEARKVVSKVKDLTFITPYQRYKVYLPLARKLLEQEERKQRELEKNLVLCPEKPAVKHKLDQEIEEENADVVHQAFKKRKMDALAGSSKTSLKIFKSDKDEDDEEMEKVSAIIDELARSRIPRKGDNNYEPQASSSQSVKNTPNRKKQAFNKNVPQSSNTPNTPDANNQSSTEKKKISRSQRKRLRFAAKMKQQQGNQQHAQGGKQKKNYGNNMQQQNRGQNQAPRKSEGGPIDLNNVDFTRFSGGSKPIQRKQFEITQKFKTKSSNNKRYRRGNYNN